MTLMPTTMLTQNLMWMRLKRIFCCCYDTNYGVYFNRVSKEPGNVALCSPVRILFSLDCIGCKNVFNFPKS